MPPLQYPAFIFGIKIQGTDFPVSGSMLVVRRWPNPLLSGSPKSCKRDTEMMTRYLLEDLELNLYYLYNYIIIL